MHRSCITQADPARDIALIELPCTIQTTERISMLIKNGLQCLDLESVSLIGGPHVSRLEPPQPANDSIAKVLTTGLPRSARPTRTSRVLPTHRGTPLQGPESITTQPCSVSRRCFRHHTGHEALGSPLSLRHTQLRDLRRKTRLHCPVTSPPIAIPQHHTPT
jgi:hypothetical protein